MKTNKNRLFAALTATTLALTPCFAAGMNVFAADPTYNITVNAKEATDSEFEAYQIFKGKVESGKLTNITWGSSKPTDMTGFLGALQANDLFKQTVEGELKNVFADLTVDSKAEAFADAMATVGDKSDAANALAKIVGKYAVSAVADSNEAKNVIGGVEAGYYLVTEKTPASNTNPISLNLLKVVDDTPINAKEDLPSLTKVITGDTAKDAGKANGVSIGDQVPYQLATKVPDMTGYTKYFFVVNDDLASGLTFNDDVAITLDGAPYTAFEVQKGAAADGHTFQIVFTNFYDNNKGKAGKDIVITYSATLNEGADRTTAGNLNTANLVYSNNPNTDASGKPGSPDEPNPPTPDNPDTPDVDESKPGDPTGQTPDKQTKTYTANIKLTKTDGENILPGAKFKIEGTAANVVLINGTAYEKDEEGTYYKLKDGTFTTTPPVTTTTGTPSESTIDKYDGLDKYKKVEGVNKDTTNTNICMEAYVKSDGTLEFGGLGAGTYNITELEAPAGYNKLTDPITVVIKGDATFDNGPKWTATKDGETIGMTDKATVEFDVVNKSGSTLPSTGGIGTKMFYLFGSAFVIGASTFIVTKKRVGENK